MSPAAVAITTRRRWSLSAGDLKPEENETPIPAPAVDATPSPQTGAQAIDEFRDSGDGESVALGSTHLSHTLYQMYLEEARAHLATLSLELSHGRRPPATEMIRAAHTLAGISATVGITPVNLLAHALEGALVRLAGSGAAADVGQHAVIGNAIAELHNMVESVASQQLPAEAPALHEDLDQLGSGIPEDLAGMDVEELELEPLPPSVEDLAIPTEPVSRTEEASGSDSFPPVAMAQPAPSVVRPPENYAPTVPASELDVGDSPASESNRRRLRLTDDLDPQLLPIFLEEANDLMREVGAELRNWRATPAESAPPQQLKRLLHTFKGSARMAGAMTVGEIVHGMESHIDQLAELPATDFLDELDAAFDRVHSMVDELNAPPDAPSLALHAVTEATHPDVMAADAVSTGIDAETELSAARAMLRVRADLVDKLANEAGEMAIARSRIEGEMRTLKSSLLDLTENVIRLRNQLREIEIQAESQMQSRQALTSEQHHEFDPLEFDRFTRFQELTRMMAESVNDVTTIQHNLLRNLEHADAAVNAQARLNRELSQALMSVRMVPFNSIADRLYRIVRQSAKEVEKRANLDIRGGQTELDRSVLEKMTGPLEHLLRNAIGHGLERQDGRRAAAKPEIGQITLNIAQAGNEISIELSDDGAGLDFARIRAKATERGLIAEEQVASDNQLTQMIFMSGFSTAESLTELAGRGIGMDVVKNETAALGGRIEVHTQAGRGTTFRVLLPLTLAVTQAVIVRAGSRTCVIPSAMVSQVMELRAEPAEKIRREGAAEWLGQSYPYQFLAQLLGDSVAQPQAARRYWILLLRAGTQRLALEVDALLGNQEIVVKNVGAQLSRVVGIAGATVLGDGEIALIINPVALVGRHIGLRAEPALTHATPIAEPVVAVPTVMVVDDSLTVRKITGRLLAREGYHVITAKDGVDALEQTLEIVPDVMLVDIEMPRMDGFDLTRNIRGDARLKNVPIIMITSRIADKHRNYANEIGVNNYLGKPYDEDELLRLIAGFTKRPSRP